MPRLATLEVPFAYAEHGERKSALVKLVLCERCSNKLLWKRRKEKEKAAAAASSSTQAGAADLPASTNTRNDADSSVEEDLGLDLDDGNGRDRPESGSRSEFKSGRRHDKSRRNPHSPEDEDGGDERGKRSHSRRTERVRVRGSSAHNNSRDDRRIQSRSSRSRSPRRTRRSSSPVIIPKPASRPPPMDMH